MRTRIILYVALSFLLGAYFATGLQNAPQATVGPHTWCYVETVPSIKEVPSLPERMLDVAGGKVHVYEPC